MTGERLSDCCGAHVKVAGNADCNYYSCAGCGKPCATHIDESKRESGSGKMEMSIK